jgi:DNA-directed RNA polymerase specialized sigma24 family protein
MADEDGLNQDKFELLLSWLDPDREQAWRKYEAIRETLINIFTWRGCRHDVDLADETVNRVMQKLPGLIEGYSGDPARYFYGVAKNVAHEYFRKEAQFSELPIMGFGVDPNRADEVAPVHQCLDHCLQQLSAKDRELILSYYQYDKRTKIQERKQLAERLGLEMNALRIRASRIRSFIAKCIRECLAQKGQAE